MALIPSTAADGDVRASTRTGIGATADRRPPALPLAALAAACTAQARIDTPLGRMLLARTAAGLAGIWFDEIGRAHV